MTYDDQRERASDFAPQHFQWTVDGRVGIITLDRPERKNPLTLESYRELTDTFLALQRVRDVRAVVITGAGGNFCSGGDVHAAGSAALAGIQSSVASVASARASLGARSARLDVESQRLTDVGEARESQRAAIEDTDIAGATIALQRTLTVLQATQASFSKLSGLSLFDYLR